MIPVLIVGGFIGLYFLIESQKKSAAQATAIDTAVAGIGASSGTAPTGFTLQQEAQNGSITGLEVGSGISAATGIAQTLNESVAAAGAIPVVGAAVSAVASILLAQHTARLKGATNENQALDQAIPAFDADLAEIAAAYNAGTATRAQTISGFQQVDAQVYAYLKAQVGAPGTAWDGTGKCTKSCTAGCCVYYNDLHSAIAGPDLKVQGGIVMDGATGLVPALQSPAAGGRCWVPEVYPPSDTAYGNYSRAGYYITLTAPVVTHL
jgi:hypothetical protein